MSVNLSSAAAGGSKPNGGNLFGFLVSQAQNAFNTVSDALSGSFSFGGAS